MKSNRPVLSVCQAAIFAVVIVTAGLVRPAYCRTREPVLLLEQTPLEGGAITPQAGVHRFRLDTTVTLTAVPNPGYQFVYWLGDVSDATANRTTVYLDAPKIVVAVFERAEFDLLEFNEMSTSGVGGRVVPSRVAAGPGGFGAPGAKRRPSPRRPRPPEPPEQPDFPVPGDSDDFPVPVPEPATAALLALGGLSAIIRRRPKRRIQNGKAD